MEEYIVEQGDTLQRLAVKFNCNPSDLARQNKISTFQSILFEGQKLCVPERKEVTRPRSMSKGSYNFVRPPGYSHYHFPSRRISVPLLDSNRSILDFDTDNSLEPQFVKVTASRIVDYSRTSFSGTLVVTSKFLIFDQERNPQYNYSSDLIHFVDDPIFDVAASISLDSVFAVNSCTKFNEIAKDNSIIFEDSPSSFAPHSTDFVEDDDVMYLVIKAIPWTDSYSGPSFQSASIKSLHKNCKQFVFSIAKERIEEVYSYLIACLEAIHNDVEESSKDPSVVQDNGEEVVENNNSLMSSISWEIVDSAQSVVADALKEFEEIKFIPQYKNGESDILSQSMLDDLALSLPIKLHGCNLYLVYKTGTHGYSLGTIYRKMKNLSSATLLLIRDNTKTVFGAFMSEPFHMSSHYYGTGETFVFHWKPVFNKYEWTRDNSFFMKGDANCFSIGATSGHNAIWFEDTLKYGRSEPTDTFENPILCGDCDDLSETNTETLKKSLAVQKLVPGSKSLPTMKYFFVIDCLEVWRFSM